MGRDSWRLHWGLPKWVQAFDLAILFLFSTLFMYSIWILGLHFPFLGLFATYAHIKLLPHSRMYDWMIGCMIVLALSRALHLHFGGGVCHP